eukprot:1592861-Rhodomonas_salina.1
MDGGRERGEDSNNNRSGGNHGVENDHLESSSPMAEPADCTTDIYRAEHRLSEQFIGLSCREPGSR